MARAQDEIRAERDRVSRSPGPDRRHRRRPRRACRQASLDKQAHEKLIDDYIEQVAAGDKGQN